MAKKINGKTIAKVGLVAAVSGTGVYKIAKMGVDAGKTIMENYGPCIQKLSGEVGSTIARYGPLAVLGGLAGYGLYLTLDSVNKQSLENQLEQ